MKDITQSDAQQALRCLRALAQDAMYSNRPNSDAYDRARYERDWADRVLKEAGLA